MIHLWIIDNALELQLNVEELLKYDILSKVYKQDTSPAKFYSKEYFKYLDFLTNSNGYCMKSGLNNIDAHNYAISQTKLDKQYVLPPNNKDIIAFVKEIEYDPIVDILISSVKALRVSSKSLRMQVDVFNNLKEEELKNEDGSVIDVTDKINKILKTLSDIPARIEALEVIMNKVKSKTTTLRGTKEYSPSMDGDVSIESYIPKQG